MIYLDLFLGFLKVGCLAFGGAYAAIPLIRDIVVSCGWLNDEMLTYMIAVSESTPGPIMINLATYVGSSQGGIPGALLATFAVVLPSFVIILLATAILTRVIGNRYVQAVLRGIKPCMAGIILATGCLITVKNLFDVSFSSADFRAAAITAVLAALYFGLGKKLKKGFSPIALILVSAVLGAAVYAF